MAQRIEPLARSIYEGWHGPDQPPWSALDDDNPDKRYRRSYYMQMAVQLLEDLDGHPLQGRQDRQGRQP